MLYENIHLTGLTWEDVQNYTGRWSRVGLMLGQRRRRWANIKPAQGQRFVFSWKEKQLGERDKVSGNFVLLPKYTSSRITFT